MIDVMRCDAMRLGFVPTGWFQMFLYLFFFLTFGRSLVLIAPVQPGQFGGFDEFLTTGETQLYPSLPATREEARRGARARERGVQGPRGVKEKR